MLASRRYCPRVRGSAYDGGRQPQPIKDIFIQGDDEDSNECMAGNRDDDSAVDGAFDEAED